jgi:hypothetical protein
VPHKEGIAVFARSLKVAFAGIGSLHVERQSNRELRELDESLQQVPEPRKSSGATDQPTSRDLDSLLDRYGIVS